MRHFLLGGLAATFIGFGMMGSASALPALLDPIVKTSTEAGVELTQVQVRRQGGGARVGNRGGARAFNRGGARFGNRGGARYGYRGGYRGGYGGGYRRGYGGGYDGGAAVGAGILGLAAGAIIGGAVANSSGGNASCAQRFRSYDPSSGTYLGYDGARHACP